MKEKVKGYMFYVAFVASLGGFLFGFDTVVVSGAEKGIQQFYGLSGWLHGFTMAVALFGTIVGALVCGKPAEKYGRLESLKVVAYLYFLSAVGCAVILNWWTLVFFRFMGGLAVGASSVVGPMYIAEIAPSNWRGRFVAFFQFNIVFGLVSAYISNWYISTLGIENDWRWMLGVLALPSVLFAALLFTIPESPRWLVKTGAEKRAAEVLDKIGDTDVSQSLADIKTSLADTVASEPLFQKKYWKPIAIAFFVATFNQLSGINAINYYAPRILESAGVFRESALLQSILIGMTNLVFTMLGMLLIDKFGRKNLLYIGSVFMTIALLSVAAGFQYKELGGYFMLGSLMLFIGAFALSLGAVIWVLISEVFPTSVRAKGQVLGSMTHWFWCALLTWAFPILVESGLSTCTFGFFALMAALTFVFALKLPITKDKSLEEIQRELTGQ
ncbi:MAG: sugar porter family MFS transporter [Candidatus Merdousia sp.]|nr:sugar porter family MFS transporter [Candidatus Merdousia sp.]